MSELTSGTAVVPESMAVLVGQRVTFFCMNYIYTGLVVRVDGDCILLSDAGVVFETGDFDNKTWVDMQKLPGDWCVRVSAIESYGVLK